MKWYFQILFVFFIAPSYANERVPLPSDYPANFVEYLSLDRTQNSDQFIRLLANSAALKGKNQHGEFEDGAVLIAEVYSVKKNADGTVKKSILGRRIKDQLLQLAVMKKQKGFASQSASIIDTGDWDFAAYKPDGKPAAKNIDACRACHAPLTTLDFVFSAEHLP